MSIKTSTTYKEVLNSPEILSYLPSNNQWWSQYVYHFSDVNNIASILNSEKMYSRNYLSKNSLMKNENASKPVIDGTKLQYKDYVRFYFRPLTPTQYANEGIRAKSQFNDLSAHCPVPIYLLFNAEKILERSDSQFSYESLASHHDILLYQSVEDFKKAPFEYIYHHTYLTQDDNKQQIIKNRHAELVIKDEYNIDELELILCRNIPEALTLMSLLNKTIFEKYKSKIKIKNSSNLLFNNTHLSLNKVTLENKHLEMKWNNPSLHEFDLKIYFVAVDDKVICQYFDKNFKPLTSHNRIDASAHIDGFNEIYINILLDENLIYKHKFKM